MPAAMVPAASAMSQARKSSLPTRAAAVAQQGNVEYLLSAFRASALRQALRDLGAARPVVASLRAELRS